MGHKIPAPLLLARDIFCPSLSGARDLFEKYWSSGQMYYMKNSFGFTVLSFGLADAPSLSLNRLLHARKRKKYHLPLPGKTGWE